MPRPRVVGGVGDAVTRMARSYFWQAMERLVSEMKFLIDAVARDHHAKEAQLQLDVRGGDSNRDGARHVRVRRRPTVHMPVP
jgi:hypothetical protein